MKINILTLFPDMFNGFLTNSIIKRAIAKKVVTINVVNIRDYTKDKYGRVDTPPVSGGAGLIMKCQPIVDALKKVGGHKVLLSPRGKTYNEDKAKEFSKLKELTIVSKLLKLLLVWRNNMIVFFSTHCPACNILESKLKDKGIEYEECNDVEAMLELGLQTAPGLSVDGKIMNYGEALRWLKDR